MKIIEMFFKNEHRHNFTPRYDKVFSKELTNRISTAQGIDFSEMLETIYVRDICNCGATIERKRNER